MTQPAKIKYLTLPKDKRVICISDIHGELDLFMQLLNKIAFCDEDILILLGDMYLKGSKCRETLDFCIKLSLQPNVHILRGNCEWGLTDYISNDDINWLETLPDIIETTDFTFVHSGISSSNLDEQLMSLAKINNFMEISNRFEKWVVTGHWPTVNYCHKIPQSKPIINKDKRIIAIDGGAVVKIDGQLNAFIIEDDNFSYTYVDDLPKFVIKKAQKESGGNLNVTWNDRHIEILTEEGELCQAKHKKSGIYITVPKSQIFKDFEGNTCICDCATDYYLPCEAGDKVSVIEAFEDRIFAKIDGVSGWIMI